METDRVSGLPDALRLVRAAPARAAALGSAHVSHFRVSLGSPRSHRPGPRRPHEEKQKPFLNIKFSTSFTHGGHSFSIDTKDPANPCNSCQSVNKGRIPESKHLISCVY